MNISKGAKLTRVSNAVAAGTSDVTCSTIDTQGYDSCVFIAAFGTLTAGAVTSVKAQQGAASDMSDAADLEGTGITIADSDDNGLVMLEITSPRERYIRCIIDRGTANAVVDGVFALQSKAGVVPVVHDSTVIGSEHHLAPAEGTA